MPYIPPQAAETSEALGKAGDVAGGAVTETLSSATGLWSDISGSMGSEFGEFIPKALGALVILVIGFIIAKIVAMIVSKVVNQTGIGNKFAGMLGSKAGGKKGSVGAGFGKGAFWVVMLFVAIACLNALGLPAVSEPITDLLKQFFNFVPKLIGAAAIGFVGYLVANFAKIGVNKGLTLSDADNRLKLAPGTLTNSLPMAAFCFILLLFLPVIFGTLQMPQLSGPIEDIVKQIMSFLPKLLIAGVLMAVFFMIAKLVSDLVTNFLQGTGFNQFPKHMGLVSDTSQMSANPSDLAGKGAMAAILLIGATQAVEILNLEVLTNVINEGVAFAGPILVGAIMLGIGLWLGNLARKAILGSNMQNASYVANLAFGGIMALSGIMALKKMGLAGEIVDLGFGLILGGAALAAGLAFGLGGRDAAAKFLDKRVK